MNTLNIRPPLNALRSAARSFTLCLVLAATAAVSHAQDVTLRPVGRGVAASIDAVSSNYPTAPLAGSQYVTGRNQGVPSRSFFVYDLPAAPGPNMKVVAAKLVIYDGLPPGAMSGGVQTLSIHGVTAPVSDLEASTFTIGDLGNGAAFASHVYNSATDNDGGFETFTLNADGLAALNASLGQKFAFSSRNSQEGVDNTYVWAQTGAQHFVDHTITDDQSNLIIEWGPLDVKIGFEGLETHGVDSFNFSGMTEQGFRIQRTSGDVEYAKDYAKSPLSRNILLTSGAIPGVLEVTSTSGNPFLFKSLDAEIPNHYGQNTIVIEGRTSTGTVVATDTFTITNPRTYAATNLAGMVVHKLVITATQTYHATFMDNFVLSPFVSNPDGYTAKQKVKLEIPAPGVLANDSGSLVVSSNTQPAHGTLAMHPDGSFIYTNAAGFTGEDSFTYTASPGNGVLLPPTKVSIFVNGKNNQPPFTTPDTYITHVNEKLSVVPPYDVLTDDLDPEGKPLTASLFYYDYINGGLNFNPNGSFTYTPHPGFVGEDHFEYVASDGVTKSAPERVSIRVNRIPVGVEDYYNVIRDQTLNVSGKGVLANDVDEDPLTAQLVLDVTHGKLVLNPDGSFSYTPEAGFVGQDTFYYAPQDDNDKGKQVAVTLTVQAPDQAPSALPDYYEALQDRQLDVPNVLGVLTNDFDLDGDALTAVVSSLPAHGTLNLFLPEGGFLYTPDPGFFGVDKFEYYATDGVKNSLPVVVVINVLAAAPNLPPQTIDDKYEGVAGSMIVMPVLTNDGDPDGDDLRISSFSYPAGGSGSFSNDGEKFTWTPPSAGKFLFYYTASDGKNNSRLTSVFVKVLAAPNSLPVATDDGPYPATAGQTLVVAAPGVLGNDTDPDGDALTLVPWFDPAHGTLVLALDGSFNYTPDAGFSGPDSFQYEVFDGKDFSAELATVTINVNSPPPNQAPVARNDPYPVYQDTQLTVNAPGVLANDGDPDNDPVSVVLPANGVTANGGSYNIGSDGALAYIPAPGFYGTDSFTYVITDGKVQSAPATVTITVLMTGTFLQDGKSIGYWSNPNGQTELTGAIDGSTLLPSVYNLLFGPGGALVHPAQQTRSVLATATGSYVPLTQWQSYQFVQNFLLGATANNMANMLSAQLLGAGLNVLLGHVDLNSKVSLALVTTLTGQNLSALAANGLGGSTYTVGELLDAAEVELVLHPLTVKSGSTRSYQEALQKIFAAINTNQPVYVN